MRLTRHRSQWWVDPELPPNRAYIPRRLLDEDPLASDEQLPQRRLGRTGSFAPSKKWVPYRQITGYDAGYITPLYSLKEIARRYGLTQNSTVYFRKNLLPEPFDLVRRRSVAAHHWSRFTLMVLDEVLRDLERLGYTQFLKSFEGHVDNLHAGVEFLEAYYGDKVDAEFTKVGDNFGVVWDER